MTHYLYAYAQLLSRVFWCTCYWVTDGVFSESDSDDHYKYARSSTIKFLNLRARKKQIGKIL